jgi:protein SCO1/2
MDIETTEPVRGRRAFAERSRRRQGAVGGLAAVVLALGAVWVRPASAVERKEAAPNEVVGVGITEHPNVKIPLELQFVDSEGKTVHLGDYFRTGKPVILTLVYFRCPMLCTLVLNGMIAGLKEIPLTLGEDFDVVTVSIDPRETPTLAKLKKQGYVKEYGRQQAVKGWHFLTGREENIKKLADAVGFQYKYVESTQQYAHPAGIFILMPDGRISRYLYGIQFNSGTLRLSLVEAGQGKIGSTVDRILLTCFHYDASSGKYSLAAFRIMQVGGVLTALVLGTVLALYWHHGSKRRRAQADADARGEPIDES